MATVNIANNTWLTRSQTSTIKIYTSNTYVDFDMGYKLTDELACAKACIEINASAYKTITLQYNSILADGITSLYFGVFDNMIAEYYYNTDYDNGISPSSLSGINVTEMPRNGGGTITIDIPSDVTGTKYVGFLFYGNTFWFEDDVGWSARQKIDIASINAVESGYTITYDANGGSGAPSALYNIISTFIPTIIPQRYNYDFLGWSTSPYDNNVSYVPGQSISLTSNTTLYAVWREFYLIVYDANGGSNAPSTSKKINGQTLTLSGGIPTPPANTSTSYMITFNANGGICYQDMVPVTHVVTYEFINWNTNRDGSGVSYQPGGLYTNDGATVLFAQYAQTVTYNSIELPIPVRNNYDFLGWSVRADDATGITGEYTPTNDVTLYAIWKIRGQVYIRDSVGGCSPYKVLIYDGSGWNQYVPYIYTESGWEVYSG